MAVLSGVFQVTFKDLLGSQLFSNPIHLFLCTLLISLATILGITLANEVIRLRLRIPNLPGPLGLPIFGTLWHLEGKIPSEEYRQWASGSSKTYGDVFQVQLGNTTAVVVNSAAAARALFIGQREATNSRPWFYVLHSQVQKGGPVTSIGTSPWDHSCRRRRKVAATALNKSSVESYLPILNLESRAFLRDILDSCEHGETSIDILDPARKLAINLSLTLAYGTRVDDVKDLHQDSLISEIMYIEERIAQFRDVSSNYLNYIPLLRPLNSLATTLGINDSTRQAADVGRRRKAYHAILQANLRAKIAAGEDRPCIQGNVLKDPESKGLSEGELLSVSLSMMAGADTTKRSLMWAMLLLAHRPDIQEKAYQAILSADASLLESPDVAQSNVEYIEALVKEIGRFFVVLRLALPKATHSEVTWEGAVIPPKTLVLLNSWACSRDPLVFSDPDVFEPERWLNAEQSAANTHQFAFGIGGRMCVASHVASKALYTVFLHLIAHFHVKPADETLDPTVADPILGLLQKGNHQAAPAARMLRFIPRNEATMECLKTLD